MMRDMGRKPARKGIMETLTEYPTNTREGSPRAVRLELCDAHQYLTFAGECDHASWHHYTRFGVIGTDYGHLHNTSGGWRLWDTASPAYRAAREYKGV